MSAPAQVDRAFARLAEGLIHYRHAGAGPARPLYMAHAGPGSSRGLEEMVALMGAHRPVIAPDMPGNGDSAPPLRRDTDIAYYADAALRLMDALGIDKVDFFGSHTGAFIGIEMARMAPARVGALVLDGVMLLDGAQRATMLARYAPEMAPDAHGGHLAWAFQFVRDMMLFYPYFERTAAARMARDLPSPEAMHPLVVDVVKALGTYHCAYRAAFAYDAVAALPGVARPCLLTCAAEDPLFADLPQAGALLPQAQLLARAAGMGPAEAAAAFEAFLSGQAEA
ncbi:MAG TPA: alpha/beta fold hydrolase [Novosphingobium sp.]|nr:alpha/beta fold hydrolase [Novosphingobium sp.]